MIQNFFFPPKVFLLVIVFTSLASQCQMDNSERLRKRQVGVLARAGILPQGKRSVEVLARNGELPNSNNAKKNRSNGVIDLLVHELETAENLNRINLEALTEMVKQLNTDENNVPMRRSVRSSLRDNGQPYKRFAEHLRRSGYLLKIPQKTVLLPTKDYLDLSKYLETHLKGAQLQSQGKDYFYEKVQEPLIDSPPDHLQDDIIIDKRFLGRIPQLGRIHQRVQSPSSRRRPHFRPNWL